jgi:hypothetical protein
MTLTEPSPALGPFSHCVLERLGGASARLVWPPILGADTYWVTRGVLSGGSAGNYGGCLINNLAVPEYVDADDPGSEGYLYLIQGKSATCGRGLLGHTSAGVPRVNSDPQACP